MFCHGQFNGGIVCLPFFRKRSFPSEKSTYMHYTSNRRGRKWHLQTCVAIRAYLTFNGRMILDICMMQVRCAQDCTDDAWVNLMLNIWWEMWEWKNHRYAWNPDLISILMWNSDYTLLAKPQGWTCNERQRLTFQPSRIALYQKWKAHYQQ